MPASDGSTYAPAPMPQPVVETGDVVIAAMHLDHGHIVGMVEGLLGAGATLAWVYDPQPERAAAFAERFPQVSIARSEAGGAGRPPGATGGRRRGALRAGRARHPGNGGRHGLLHRQGPLISLAQRAWAERGAIGQVIQVLGLGPHRLGDLASRPDWFYRRADDGGILTDIGSHAVEQMLTFSGSDDVEILSSAIANHAHPEHPELDDFGEASFALSSGASG